MALTTKRLGIEFLLATAIGSAAVGTARLPDGYISNAPAVQRFLSADLASREATMKWLSLSEVQRANYTPQANLTDYSVPQAHSPIEGVYQNMKMAEGLARESEQNPIVKQYLEQEGEAKKMYLLAAVSGLCAWLLTRRKA